MLKLFVIYIGGAHDQALIELHDMRFVVAETIEDSYEVLGKSWWGIPASLHLDAWGILNYADGYDLHLQLQPTLSNSNKLYFVNLGGYDQSQFTELHKNIFVVAASESEAKVRAVAQISGWESPHRDYQYAAERVINVSEVIEDKNIHVHLHPSKNFQEFAFTCKYVSIGKE